MNLKLLFIFLTGFTLFHYQCKKFNLSNKRFYHFRSQKKPKNKIKRYGRDKIALLLSVNTGNKKLLKKDVKKKYISMGLAHLFTPSGIHLYPIGRMLKLIFPKWLQFIVNMLLYTYFFNLKSFWSIRRILCLKTLNIVSRKEPFINFILCFFIDYLLGSFQQSPLSFCFSYLFLGSVIFSKNKIQLCRSLYLAQLLTSYYFQSDFNLISPLIGIALTSLFTFIFPFAFLNFWIFYKLEWSLILSFPLNFFHKLVIFSHNICSFIPPIHVSLSILTIGFLFYIQKNKAALISLLFMSSMLNEPHLKSLSKTKYSHLLQYKHKEHPQQFSHYSVKTLKV